MNKTDWQSLIRQTDPTLVTGRIWRVVESQQQVATTELVDDLSEQAILEDLLETSKPACPPGCENLHYLLKTPFRYPPLRWGSRFGNRFEPGIFYAAHTQRTALAETAFYRLLFLDGMLESPKKILSQHLMFAAQYRSNQGVKLQQSPFNQHSQLLADPMSYQHSQILGSELRQQGYQAIEFISARDQESGINVALLTPKTLRNNEPEKTLRVLAQTSTTEVIFKFENKLKKYPTEQFLVEGLLLRPN